MYNRFLFSLGTDVAGAGGGQVQSLDNLCGDLNKGYIPKSPLGRNVNGHAYPLWVKLTETQISIHKV